MVQGSRLRWRVGQASRGQPSSRRGGSRPSRHTHTCRLRSPQPPAPLRPCLLFRPPGEGQGPLGGSCTHVEDVSPPPFADPGKDACGRLAHFRVEKPKAQTQRGQGTHADHTAGGG